MIGGRDFIIASTRPEAELRELVQQRFKRHWPAMVVENFGPDCFLYRDEASRRSWDEHGRTDDNDDAMVYAMFDASGLTMVAADEDGAETAKVAEELTRELNEV